MKCPKCGKEVSDSAVFCVQCGQKLNGMPEYNADNMGEGNAFLDGSFAPSPFGASTGAYDDPYAAFGASSQETMQEWDPYSQILKKNEDGEAEEEAPEAKLPKDGEAEEEEPAKEKTPEGGTSDPEPPKKTPAEDSGSKGATVERFSGIAPNTTDSFAGVGAGQGAAKKKKSKFQFFLVVLIAALAVYIGYRQGNQASEKPESGVSVADSQKGASLEEGAADDTQQDVQGDADFSSGSGSTPESAEAVETPVPSEPEAEEEIFPVMIEEELNTEPEEVDAGAEAAAAPAESVVSLVDFQTTSIDSSKKIQISSAQATSTIVQETTTNEPMRMFDDKMDTNWQEGVDGPGIEQGFTAEFQETSNVKYMIFYLGNWKTDNYFYGNNRPKKLTLELGEFRTQVEFPDKWEAFCVEVTPACTASSLTVTIDEVYAGTSWDDTVITDISLYRE